MNPALLIEPREAVPPIISSRYTYPVLERITRDDGVRHYVTPDGEALSSVTTILSATSDKTFLKEWEERVGTKKANAIRYEATGLGTLMHEHMECFVEGRERPRGNNLVRQMARKMADVIIRDGMPQVTEVWGVETPLYFPGLFAGTSDLVGLHEGEPAIFDFKNAKKMRTLEQINDYFDQLSAYALAHNAMFGTNIRKGVIFMCARDLSFKTFVMEGKDFDDHVLSFMLRVEKFMFDM